MSLRYEIQKVGGAQRTTMCNQSDVPLYIKYGNGLHIDVRMSGGRDTDLHDHDIVVLPFGKHALFDNYVGWITYWWWPRYDLR